MQATKRLGFAARSTFGDLSRVHEQVTNPNSSDESTYDTVERMSRLARHYSKHPLVVQALAQARAESPHLTTPRAVWQWVKSHVEFVTDEDLLSGVLGEGADNELLIAPDVLLTMPRRMGDCDDFSLLMGSMLLAGEQPVSFVTIAADPAEPERWSHIYIESVEDGQPLVLDASHGPAPGWEAGEWFRKQRWQVSGKRGSGRAGLDWTQAGREPMLSRTEGTPTVRGLRGSARYDRGSYQGIGQLGEVVPWTEIMQQGARTGIDLVSKIYGQPRLARGTFIQRTPGGGEVLQRAPAGPQLGVSTFPPTAFSPGGGDILKWVLVIAGIGVVVMAIKK